MISLVVEGIQKAGENLLGSLGLGGLAKSQETDPISGPVEGVSEMIAPFVEFGKQMVLAITDAIGLPSIKEMSDEIQAELQAADLVCDKIGGQSIKIPNPFGASPELCFSSKQLTWAFQPQNLLTTGKIALSCGLEEIVTDPVDFVGAGINFLINLEGDKIAGWLAGLLAGEALPALSIPQLFTMPSQLSACMQTKIAKEMGDMTDADIEKLEKDIYKFTKRDTGLARKLLKDVGL